jgi:hypothetical protein
MAVVQISASSPCKKAAAALLRGSKLRPLPHDPGGMPFLASIAGALMRGGRSDAARPATALDWFAQFNQRLAPN